MKGKVYIVGAGPGDPELLTLKALRVLGLADVVLHDDLVPAAILERVSPAAAIFDVGKRCGRKFTSQTEINSLLVTYATAGFTVVRLQGGDPLVFGRAGEEIRALREAGVDFEIIPGVTAATTAAAAVGVSLTERHVASKVILMTGHHCAGRAEKASGENRIASVDSAKLAPPANAPSATQNSTFVVYMPSDIAAVAAEFHDIGLDATTPCLIVSAASTGDEQTYFTTLAELPSAPSLPSPKILIVGEVVGPKPDPQDVQAEQQSTSLQSPVDTR
jgi:uroporphyrin-III C-methyltransferase